MNKHDSFKHLQNFDAQILSKRKERKKRKKKIFSL